MNVDNPWKLVKAGFWLGIGFIIPTIIVYFLGTMIVAWGMVSFWEPENILTSDISADQIAINEYKDSRNDNQVVIVGSLTNNSTSTANSIELEAEMYNAQGEFVYECSEYINDEVEPGKTENFQIKCGCGENPVPTYDSVKVRVVGVMDF